MKRSRMRQVSPKRRARDRTYPAARQAVWERAAGWCEAAIDPVCTGDMVDVHHKAGRLGPDPHALENLLGLCRACHDWIGAHPAESYRRGFMVRRNQENVT